jgi:pyruvate dehydrogenase E1 component alpha subunit
MSKSKKNNLNNLKNNVELHSVNLTKQEWIRAFESMLLIRRFEEKCGQLYGMGKISGFCHLYIGQEAVIAAASISKKKGDSMMTGYRDHGHGLMCLIEPKHLLAELMGKATGSSKGKGGSMHIFNKVDKFYGGHGIVGSPVSIGTGLAFAEKYNNTNNICYTFFGDGSANQGQVFESFNMAKLWNLPVLYVIENNGYAMGTSVARSTFATDLFNRGLSLGIEGERVDGMKFDVLCNAFMRASKFVRNGGGPKILEVETYRFRGHSMSDPANYRSKEEVENYKQSDPIVYLRNCIIDRGIALESELKEVEAKVKDLIKEAVDFAENSAIPDPKEMQSDVLIHSNL